jgi:hypothetical protein
MMPASEGYFAAVSGLPSAASTVAVEPAPEPVTVTGPAARVSPAVRPE